MQTATNGLHVIADPPTGIDRLLLASGGHSAGDLPPFGPLSVFTQAELEPLPVLLAAEAANRANPRTVPR